MYDSIEFAIKEYRLPMDAFWTVDLPGKYHFHPNSRIGPITIIAHPVFVNETSQFNVHIGLYVGENGY